MSKFAFTANEQNHHRARTGQIITPHGIIETPAFIFCATKATIKSVDIERVRECNTQIILSNTYHLMLQPGADVVEKLGGLHKMLGWDKPMFTDSGGFQIFSLGHGSVAEEIKGNKSNVRPQTLLKINEQGATFRSYVDGSLHQLTPELSIDIQRKLGADLIVVLDECTPFNVDRAYTARSMQMSHRWATRCLTEFTRKDDGRQALYGIVQGGIYPDLRQEACDFINDMPFFAHAIGGSLGASKQQMYDIVNFTADKLRRDRPIHLLGIGGIEDIFCGVAAGIDTFDCVHPTRIARHGSALVKRKNAITAKDHINLRNQMFCCDNGPIEDDCQCFTCTKHSRGYIHHLLKAKELLAHSLITIHNIHFMNHLMTSIRSAILTNSLGTEKEKW